jgi:hypothetical protein
MEKVISDLEQDLSVQKTVSVSFKEEIHFHQKASKQEGQLREASQANEMLRRDLEDKKKELLRLRETLTAETTQKLQEQVLYFRRSLLTYLRLKLLRH